MGDSCNHPTRIGNTSDRPSQLPTSKPDPRGIESHKDADQGKKYRSVIRPQPTKQRFCGSLKIDQSWPA